MEPDRVQNHKPKTACEANSAQILSVDTVTEPVIPDGILASNVPIPATLDEALDDSIWREHWKPAIRREYDQHIDHGTWR